MGPAQNKPLGDSGAHGDPMRGVQNRQLLQHLPVPPAVHTRPTCSHPRNGSHFPS